MAMMGLRAYARHRGCALSAVQKALATGRIQAQDGKIDAEAADRAWASRTDPAKQRKDPPPAPPPASEPPLLSGEVLPAPTDLSRRPTWEGWPPPPPVNRPPAAVENNVVAGDAFMEWRTRRERAAALREEAKQLEDQRLLVNADEVRQTMRGIGRIYSASRDGLAAEIAPLVVGLTDTQEIERRIRKVLREADERVVREIQARYAEMAQDGERSGTGQ